MRSLNGFGCTFCFNTQPPEGGWSRDLLVGASWMLFQHAAARRRLKLHPLFIMIPIGFNTQPPEGG